MSTKCRFLAAAATGCCLTLGAASTSRAAVVINANDTTTYLSADLSGQSLTPAAADLGTTKIYNANVSNTSWTSAPSFLGMGSQQFRLTNFTGANWSNSTFTSGAGSFTQFFQQANFTDANFSGATFDATTSTNAQVDILNQATFDGSDFSGATILLGASTHHPFYSAVFNGASNFNGSTIIAASGQKYSSPTTFAGSTFEGATIGFTTEGINLDGVSFKNATTVTGADFRSSHANNTNFQGTDFSGVSFANHLPSLTWDPGMAPTYDANTIFTTRSGTFDPVAAGWTFVPEPTGLIALGGLLLAGLRRRR
jgi:uncharacterized protein YjbI with pentapeptide repeats